MNSRPSKRRRVSPPLDSGRTLSRKTQTSHGSRVEPAFFNKSAANWDLERDYANRTKKNKSSDRLPIRTSDGQLKQAAPKEVGRGGEEGDDSEDDDDDKNKDDEIEKEEEEDEEEEEDKPRVSEAQQIRTAKEDLAKIALKLNESPEEHPGAFKALALVAQDSRSLAVQKLRLATQLAVYKDVIPGYRIRTMDDPELPGTREKLSSDVRRLQAYEQSLLAGYQAYLKELARLGRRQRDKTGLADVALSCACALLGSVPHFNFREDLLRILVGKLSTRCTKASAASFGRCRAALERLFREDDEGRPSMEAVSLLAKMIKARDYRVDESVLNMFLHLRLLSEFAGKASQDRVETAQDRSVPKKAKREFRTKRERKQVKEQKVLDRELAQADALVAHEERDRMQSETLKLVFATYFRVLKLRVPSLMGAVLEGLAKYAHLINQDFFGDLLEALKDLVRHGGGVEDDNEEGDDNDEEDDDDDDDDEDVSFARSPSREALLCTVTAYALLAGQDAHNARGDLHLDLTFFTTHLFRSLFPLALEPDIERHANSLQQRIQDATTSSGAHSSSSSSSKKVNLQTTTVLLVRCLTAVLLPAYNIRSVPPLRLAAFTKQAMTTALHVPEKSCQALLALLHDVAHTHDKKISALWNTEERKGDGTYKPLSETPETSNPFAATIWEGELLRHHYCPKVREGVLALEKNMAVGAARQ